MDAETRAMLLPICNPGAVVGFKGKDESLPLWQMRAILASDWLKADRERVREECAKIAEAWLVRNSIGQLSARHRERNNMARSIASAIRAAKEGPK